MVPVFGAVVLFANLPLSAVEAPIPPVVIQTASGQQAPVAAPESPVPTLEPAPAPTTPPSVAAGTPPEALPVAPAAQNPATPDAAVDPAAQQVSGGGLVDDDILVSARRRSPGDPAERVNVESYKAVQAIDRAFVGPVANGYKKAIPKPIRNGIHNFLDHVQEPIVFLNYLLQLKPGKAAETLGRFAINSTIGLAGTIDMAKRRPFKLPHRPNSLANTLGYYGVKPGPYFFLPLIGPTTARDLFGITIDRLILPVSVGTPFNKLYYTLPMNTLSALDYRVTFDDKLTVLHTATDPYAATRDDYLRKRKAEIDHLHSPSWSGHRLPEHPVTPATAPAPVTATSAAAGVPGTVAAPATPPPAPVSATAEAPVTMVPAAPVPVVPAPEGKAPEAATPTP
ncbi:MAG: MlaA family lipoprotein [Pseudomonadota bacterium]|uniref:MlaA family lipoprotein n=1 Tax=Sphingomonas sp. ERG5 TaxID=1381597 RepID=UPI00068F78D5|nr:VacJ family lipoprotein [Sphingomonas sp. ERG5]